MFRIFLFYFVLALSITGLADTLTVPETHVTLNPNYLTLTKPTGSRVVISRAQIQKSGAKNFTELLQNVSGIAVRYKDSQTSPSINLRGFGDNGNANTVIMLDGFPLVTPDASSAYLNMIPIESIQSIEILPESNSVLYGNGAVGGVVNIITQKPKHFMAGASIGAGSYDGNGQSVYLGNKIKTFYYIIHAKKLRTDNNRQHNTLNQNDGQIELGYQGDTTQTDFSYHDGYLNEQYPGTIQQPHDDQIALTHYDYTLFHLNHNLGDNWRTDNHLGYKTANTSGYLPGYFTQSGRELTLMPKLIGTLPFADILTTTGFTLRSDQYQLNSDLGKTANTDKIYATYTNWKIPFKQFYSLIFGVNAAKQDALLNSVDGSNNAVVTEQSLNYNPNNEWRLYVRRAGTYRFPGADESGDHNQLLHTQTGNSYETGFTQMTLKTLLKMEIYVLDLKNEISYAISNPQHPTDYPINRNLNPTRRIGLLVHGHYQLTSLLTLYGDYNLVDPYYRSGPFKNKTIPLVSKQLVNIGAGYEFKPRWQWYMATLYTSGSFASGDDLNQHHIGGYTLLNSNINYKYKEWEIAFKVNNLLNKQYSTYTLFSPFVQSLSDYPAPGRNYWVTLSYEFN